MAAEKTYKHFILRRLVSARPFQPTTRGGSDGNETRIVDRDQHARMLLVQLAAVGRVIEDAAKDQKRARVPAKLRGLPVRLKAARGFELQMGERNLNSPGMQLLTADYSKSWANVFLPKKSKTLSGAIEKYQTYSDGDKPRNFWLIDRLAELSVASIRDLWTDDEEAYPKAGERAIWELWIQPTRLSFFRQCASAMGVRVADERVSFPDADVVRVEACEGDLQQLVFATGVGIELRAASSLVTDLLDLAPEHRATAVNDLARTLQPVPPSAPRVALLDTGVKHRNPLLTPALPRTRCRTASAGWPTSDHNGHGTWMAGVALYQDLAGPLREGRVPPLRVALESCTVIPPDATPSLLSPGVAIERGVRRIEQDDAEEQPRVFCLAASAPNDRRDGRQSSLSSLLDDLSFGNGSNPRLFCVATGNVPTPGGQYRVRSYASLNRDWPAESPAQAFNVLTVGAYTNFGPPGAGVQVVAPDGDLCPTSRTTVGWRHHRAIKPDIVMEGGNHRKNVDGRTSVSSPELRLITTGHDVQTAILATTGQTSAATAAAAGLAGRILSAYPRLRPETIRALMVHSAEWTDAMLDRLQGPRDRKESWDPVLRAFGFGTPDEGRALTSLSNALTLVVEDELQPFLPRARQATILNEMKYFQLPWPTQCLRALGATEVELKVTLSYFMEPNPSLESQGRMDRYMSGRLSFFVKPPDDSHQQAMSRVNGLIELDDGEEELPRFVDEGWMLGAQRRNRGSIHHDIWSGPANDLALRGGIAVYPRKGWWADRKDRADGHIRFSLVVSISTPESENDLCAEVQNIILAQNLT